jgi:hypothetical protein
MTPLPTSWTFIFSSCSASQDIPCALWIPKVRRRVHNSPPSIAILSKINPVHISPSHFLNIHFNIILPSTRTSSSGDSSCFPTKTPCAFLVFSVRATCLTRLFVHDLIRLVIFGEEYESWSYWLCSFLQSFDTSAISTETSSPASHSGTVCVLSVMLQTEFHTRAMQKTELQYTA